MPSRSSGRRSSWRRSASASSRRISTGSTPSSSCVASSAFPETACDAGSDRNFIRPTREAERAYRRALRISGPDAETCFNLGNVVYSRGDKKQAVHLFLEAVHLDEEYVEAWNNLGNVLAELEELREAIGAYRKALDIEPLYADAHFNLAEALSHSGEVDEARVHWRAYLRQDPRSSWAEQVRKASTGDGGQFLTRAAHQRFRYSPQAPGADRSEGGSPRVDAQRRPGAHPARELFPARARATCGSHAFTCTHRALF